MSFIYNYGLGNTIHILPGKHGINDEKLRTKQNNDDAGK